MLTNLLASISQSQLEKVVQPVIDVCNHLVPVALMVVGAIGALWCILLGVKYAKTDDPQEHEKAKKGLKNAIIGFVLIGEHAKVISHDFNAPLSNTSLIGAIVSSHVLCEGAADDGGGHEDQNQHDRSSTHHNILLHRVKISFLKFAFRHYPQSGEIVPGIAAQT